jgi:mRNA interferase RelE/StbE
MSFSIEWDENARDFLNKLPKNIAKRIFDKVESIKENPFRFLEHYEGEYYKLRIGDYRALIDINFNNNILTVQVLDKRGRIYKR